MATLIMIERKPANNIKINQFIESVSQYFENEGFRIVDDSQHNIIILYSLLPVAGTKLTGYITTIKNTTNYESSINSVYSTSNLTKV